ncbi:hypothetical protein [Oleiharenicola lentus]
MSFSKTKIGVRILFGITAVLLASGWVKVHRDRVKLANEVAQLQRARADA